MRVRTPRYFLPLKARSEKFRDQVLFYAPRGLHRHYVFMKHRFYRNHSNRLEDWCKGDTP